MAGELKDSFLPIKLMIFDSQLDQKGSMLVKTLIEERALSS